MTFLRGANNKKPQREQMEDKSSEESDVLEQDKRRLEYDNIIDKLIKILASRSEALLYTSKYRDRYDPNQYAVRRDRTGRNELTECIATAINLQKRIPVSDEQFKILRSLLNRHLTKDEKLTDYLKRIDEDYARNANISPEHEPQKRNSLFCCFK